MEAAPEAVPVVVAMVAAMMAAVEGWDSARQQRQQGRPPHEAKPAAGKRPTCNQPVRMQVKRRLAVAAFAPDIWPVQHMQGELEPIAGGECSHTRSSNQPV